MKERGLSPEDIIYDVGANNGDDSTYYLAKGCRVVAIDANPAMCQLLRERFSREISQGRMKVVNVGVSDKLGELDFHVNRSKSAISTFEKERFEGLEWVPNDWQTVRVPVVPLSDLIREHGSPLFIKIDVEFFDRRVLLDLLMNRIKPPFISAEAQEIEVYCLLVAMGYKSFRLVSGVTVDEEFAEATIGTVDDSRQSFRFVYDSSGPFGDDLAEGWASAEETLRRLLSHGLGWIDLHARSADRT
jgi:FkbM family methyltransferase